MEIEVKGHSGCSIEIVRQGKNLIIEKGTKDPKYIERLYQQALKQQKGIILYDDPKNHIYPNSIVAKDKDAVYVGRIRKDLSCENGLLLYCVADNIRKGAAANAVQIALALDLDKCKK